ncbi:MAG TPA: tyrosine--tRNA ligase, partial [Gemmatimonadales bacterium]|nr:tyrosine--tRNA ligase [Gemmatimonadales bacterium]
ERPVLPLETVEANAAAIRNQLSHFLQFEGKHPAQLRNNAEWLRGLSLLEFLRDTGKHLTINYMLQKEAVRTRMETGMSFAEFTYMLIQAYDFWHLATTAGCELQMGGSDQWGNITAGIELIGRREQKQVHGLSFPLLTNASGTKFGKSEGGNIWLDPERTSPYRFYQFWLNTDDRDVERHLRLFTFMPLEEIAEVMATHSAHPERREAQRILAADLTSRVHGADTAERVVAASQILFGGGDIRVADPAIFELLATEVPTHPIPDSALTPGLGVVDALVAAGLASSKADARRGLQSGGFSVNGERIADAQRQLTAADLLAGRYLLLQKGKKQYGLLVARR